MFSTVKAIRKDAGLEFNTNIVDETIEGYQKEAYAVILSAVAARYRLDSISTLVIADPGYLMLQNVERLIAAGMILNKEFPGDETDDNSKGNEKIDRWDKILEDIIAGNKRLLFADNTEVVQLGTDGVWGKSRLVTDNFECRDVPEDVKW